MQPLTFVVGTGRSGSTVLSRILHLHPDVLSVNELLASLGDRALPPEPLTGAEFWRLLADPNPIFDRLIRSGLELPEFRYTRRPGRYSAETTGIPAVSHMVLPALTDDPDGLLDALRPTVSAWPHRPAAEHYAALFRELCRRFERRAVVERSGYSLGWVAALHDTFPDARFVHLFRDGPDCALSMSRHLGYRTITLLREILERAGVASLSDLTPDHVRHLPPELAGLLGEHVDPALVRDRTLPVARFGALWSRIIEDGVADLARVPARQRTTLAYEDLLDSPREELARLAAFVGVAASADWLAAGSALLDPAHRGAARALDPDERAALHEACAPGAEALRRAAGPGPATAAADR